MNEPGDNTNRKSSRKLRLLESMQVSQKIKLKYLNSRKTFIQRTQFDVYSPLEHVERTLGSIPQMSSLLMLSNVLVRKHPKYTMWN
jgi:hypothetical protein